MHPFVRSSRPRQLLDLGPSGRSGLGFHLSHSPLSWWQQVSFREVGALTALPNGRGYDPL